MTRRAWVWFDFENTPHVLFLEPLIHRVAAMGLEVRITAKPQSQTLDLTAIRGLSVEVIGRGEHVGTWGKLVGGASRAMSLAAWARRGGKPALMVSSSRTASLAAWILRLPAVGLLDYEHAEHRALAAGSESLWFPDLLRDVPLPPGTRRVARFYAGLKENLYLDGQSFDRGRERAALGINPSDYLVVSRPPAEGAHYAASESSHVWLDAVTMLHQSQDVRILVLPRTQPQREGLTRSLRQLDRVSVVQQTVGGPATIAAADLVLSGGGTMNREAAVLGIPAWSVFAGPTPHIDERLAAEGRLRWVRSKAELDAAGQAGRPPRLSPRGPFPEGIEAISHDISSRLGRVLEQAK